MIRFNRLYRIVLVLTAVSAAVRAENPARFRLPAPLEDGDPLIEEPVFGTVAGHPGSETTIRPMEWVVKRIWHHLGISDGLGEHPAPDWGSPTVGSDGLIITNTIALGGVPVRNQVVTCDIQQVNQPLLILLRSTDAFGEVLIEMDLPAGKVSARSVTVNRTMIGGVSHSSPMPEQSAAHPIAEAQFPPAASGWQRLRIRTQGEHITLWINDREVFKFSDPDPAGGKFGFGSVGTMQLRNVQQWELISPAEKQRRSACWADMHAFAKALDADYDNDVRQRNKLEKTADGAVWTYLPTGTSARFRVSAGVITATLTSGLYGNETLIDGPLAEVAVVAQDGRVFRADPAGKVDFEPTDLGIRARLPLTDGAGKSAVAILHAKFTVQNLWFWTVTTDIEKPKHIQAFVGTAPAFSGRIAEDAAATSVPHVADHSISRNATHYRNNYKVGVYISKLVPETTIGTRIGGKNEVAVSTTEAKLRFVTMWLPAQPLNKIGFSRRMVHYIKYPEGPVEHWRRRPSYQEYPTDVDLRRFRGYGTDAMVWHHTWLSTDYRCREAFLINEPEMKRAMETTHRLGMAMIGYIGIVPGRSSLLGFEDLAASGSDRRNYGEYEKNWDLQDFTFYHVAGRWQEYLPWMTDYWCREYGIDGFYADGGLANPILGPRQVKPVFPEDEGLSADELQHRLYYRVKKVLARHNARFGLENWGGGDMLVIGFYDCRMIGESFQEARPEAYRDGYNALLTGTPFKMYGMRATSQNPYNIAMAAVCMSDIQVCSGNGAWGDDPDTSATWARVRPFWQVMETIDWDRLIEARPWYAQELVHGDGFYAGNYTEPQRVLIFLAARQNKPGLFDVQIRTDRLPPIQGRWQVRYAYGRLGSIGPLPQNGQLTIDLPSLRDGPIGIELVAGD